MLESSPHAEVLRRVFDLAGRGLTRPLAESILALDFPDHDADRVAQLSAKAEIRGITSALELESVRTST